MLRHDAEDALYALKSDTTQCSTQAPGSTCNACSRAARRRGVASSATPVARATAATSASGPITKRAVFVEGQHRLSSTGHDTTLPSHLPCVTTPLSKSCRCTRTRHGSCRGVSISRWSTGRHPAAVRLHHMADSEYTETHGLLWLRREHTGGPDPRGDRPRAVTGRGVAMPARRRRVW